MNPLRFCFFLLWIYSLGISGSIHSQGDVIFPVSASQDGRYFMDADGKPFLMNGDTPWHLIVDLTTEEVLYYLSERQKQGVNTLLVDLLSEDPVKMATACNCEPFFNDDFDKPNRAYFDHAVWVIDQCRKFGMEVLLVPAYWGCCNVEYGWSNEIQLNGEEKIFRYGQYIGELMVNKTNIIWTLGGDSDEGSDYYQTLREGILSRDAKAKFVFHSSPPKMTARFFSDLDYNALYTYYYGKTNAGKEQFQVYKLAKDSWDYEVSGKTKGMPAFLIESQYEKLDHPASITRRQMYWTVLGGALGGHIYGHEVDLGTEENQAGICCYFEKGWKEQINSPGAQALKHFSEIFKMYEWWKLEPDFLESDQALITAGRGTPFFTSSNSTEDTKAGQSDRYIVAASADDGSLIMAYVPPSDSSQRIIEVNLTRLKGRILEITWINPATGQRISVDRMGVNTKSKRVFRTPPDHDRDGFNDWLLVIQAKGKK